jgi:predicted RNA methylase
MIEAETSQQAAYFALRERLLGPQRHAVLTTDELCEVGRVMHGDPEGMSLYGIPAPRMAAHGLRVLGRTAVECTSDPQPARIAAAVAALPAYAPDSKTAPIVADLFCGSGNVGHQVSLILQRPGYGSELDPIVHAATRHNLAAIESPFTLLAGDYRDLLQAAPALHPDDLFIVEPPWGDAFTTAGLDLALTRPPVPEILSAILHARQSVCCVVVIETSVRIVGDSLAATVRDATHLCTLAPELATSGPAVSHYHFYRIGSRS